MINSPRILDQSSIVEDGVTNLSLSTVLYRPVEVSVAIYEVPKPAWWGAQLKGTAKDLPKP